MLKMVCFFHLLVLCFLGFNVAGLESVEILTLYDSTPLDLQASSYASVPVAVSVGNEHLSEVSSSVLMAEKWVRTNVLSHYPATNITTIVVGHAVLCNKNQQRYLGLVLPSLKNIHHSLIRWGLEREIKVSASLSSNCLQSHPFSLKFYRVDLADTILKPLLHFLQDTNSTYLVNPPPNLSNLHDDTLNLVTSHSDSMKNLGIFNLNKINIVITADPKNSKSLGRKLSSIDPFPARPTPLTPTHSPIGYSVPAFVAKSPLPPLVGTASPPLVSPPIAPELPPMVGPANPPYGHNLPPMIVPANPPYGHNLPPCNPHGGGSGGAPVSLPGTHNGLWCVAKPSVPADTLQEAMNYACGNGGADCAAIRPQGSCYFPDSLVAHASYAFNSYWQKNKRNGGTCGFGGTAMLINSDPSYRQCHFLLS